MTSSVPIANPAYEYLKEICDTISTIERQYAAYIFAKYIKPTITSTEQEEQENKCMNILFIKKKPMTVDSQLQLELDEIAHANADYAADPKAFPSKKTEHGYPEEFRCNFIRQEKIYLKRCHAKSVDNEFYCTQHMNTPNKHLREYEKAVSDLQ